jgi:hypothetical protein
VLIVLMALPAMAQEKEGVAVTVYNGGYGVVREIRGLEINKDGEAMFKDVASHIDPTTVHFKSLTDDAAKLLEQNYQYDLVSADKLLKKYLDKQIEVICAGDKKYAGALLSFDGMQIVLKEEAGIAMIQRPQNVRDIRFKELPEGLLTRPTLLWKVATAKPGRQLAEVTYQTNGIGWHAEYVLVLSKDDTSGDMAGWVSVDNQSGKTYKEAKLKFIAGDVRRERPAPRQPAEYARKASADASFRDEGMVEKGFFEYHMYTLPRPSTVADNEVKQLEMFSPVAGVKTEKKYLYHPLRSMYWYGGRYTDQSYGVTGDKKVAVFIEFRNSAENKLGIPLPAGKVRVYKQDEADKAMEFIGEHSIDHTPKDEKLSLQIGNAFDLVGERTQKDFKIAGNMIRETIEFKLRNHKKEPVTIRIKEPLYRWKTWTILTNSHEKEFQKLDAQTVVWDVVVPPLPKPEDEGVKVTYMVEYTW